jgi:nuclear pore complex protein Nup205
MLVVHVLKRNAGIGGQPGSLELEESVEELAEALMVLITATGFLEFEEEMAVTSGAGSQMRAAPALFH